MIETETRCGLCLYHWVCNCYYSVDSVSTIGFVTVLTCVLCFYHWFCNCSYGVVSVSTIVRTVTNPIIETETTP
jgi:hypothetical protein